MPVSTCNPAPNCSGFRPREAFLSPLWRLVSDHLDAFLSHYSERHLLTHGTLALHVEKVWNDFLKCGDYNQGMVLLMAGRRSDRGSGFSLVGSPGPWSYSSLPARFPTAFLPRGSSPHLDIDAQCIYSR